MELTWKYVFLLPFGVIAKFHIWDRSAPSKMLPTSFALIALDFTWFLFLDCLNSLYLMGLVPSFFLSLYIRPVLSSPLRDQKKQLTIRFESDLFAPFSLAHRYPFPSPPFHHFAPPPHLFLTVIETACSGCIFRSVRAFLSVESQFSTPALQPIEDEENKRSFLTPSFRSFLISIDSDPFLYSYMVFAYLF